jgi:hypothetical protein
MKKPVYFITLLLLFSCGPSIEEQIESKKMELKKQVDKLAELNDKFVEASEEYSDAIK